MIGFVDHHPFASLALMFGLLAAHEAGHVLTTLAWGGRWTGVVWSGWGVGVRLTLDGLTPRQQVWTVAAGPLAEWVGVAIVAWLWPAGLSWALTVTVLQTVVNGIPWGIVPNDGTRLWRAWRTRRLLVDPHSEEV